MKKFLRKLVKALAYFAAALVIVLAIAVGIFRLMLPRLPEYQEEIKSWASAAIGLRVDFAGMNARWRLSGPELSFFGADLSRPDTGESVLNAGEISMGVGLLRLIADRELVVDRVSIRNTEIDVNRGDDGEWLIQGMRIDDLLGARKTPGPEGAAVEVVGQNIRVNVEHPETGRLVPVSIRTFSVVRDSKELRVEANMDLPEEYGKNLEVSANQLAMESDEDVWRIYIEGDTLNVAGWSRLQTGNLPEVTAGSLDVNAWLDVARGHVESATANVVLSGLAARDAKAPVDVQGSFEFSTELDGWLLAANQLRLKTELGDWPESTLQVRIIQHPDGSIDGIRANARYFKLDDLVYLSPWLPPDYRQKLADYAPTGTLRGVNVEFLDIGGDDLDFDVSADLDDAGIAATADRPGVRKLSGRVRADRDGGRVEIESTGLVLDLESILPAPLVFDDASGTVIWRRNLDGLIVLSDSVRIRNTDLDSQMSLQVTAPADGSSPVVDFQSNWSVADLAAMRHYLPTRFIMPKLRQWLTEALVSGRVSQGTTRFHGALDRFPFDDGDGEFRIEASLEDAVLRYSENWPAPEFRHLDLVVDNVHLYSTKNSAVNLGNSVENAHIEIPDLRKPVLSIKAFATGTLESIRNYAAQSPINDVLGGQLDRVEVGGDASFDLSISYPIQDKEAYDFSTRIRASDGVIRVVGFGAPITELNGVVDITRDDVSSESLFGRFLGQPVDLTLSRIKDPTAPHSVVLKAVGRATAKALQDELGLPLEGVAKGDAGYHATLRFPNSMAPEPGSLQILVETDLFGFQSDLPDPLHKADDVALPMTVNIDFPSEDKIDVDGSLAGEINWTAEFLKEQDSWDFDRGVLAVGGDYPQVANVRGLHIQGQANDIDLTAWLKEGRRGAGGDSLGDRIRSIDLYVDNLYAVGQKFTGHRVVVDRSGMDWIIRMTGPQAEGQITVPFDFDSGRPIALDMQRLFLPGNDDAAGAEPTDLDPTSLPGISIHADEFAFGDRHFGQLDVDFARSEQGLEAESLKTADDSFTLEGSAGWILDPAEEAGQRTYLDAVLHSTNVQATSSRLSYEPGISSDLMDIDLKVGWPGGPREDFLAVLNGSVKVDLGAGRLTDVEPGAGRVFGLMSFVALPRRLALDFSDVFDTGFSFDRITGNFRIADGEAYTCDLTLTGPAADVGIVGRAGLAERDYDQSAIVSANVGNTLPVVGLLTGGPQVAAALMVFSQIFKKPLKDMGQVYYTVGGSWDEPKIDSANSAAFAETSGKAGCLAATQ